MNSNSTVIEAKERMLDILREYLPEQVDSLPKPMVVVDNLTERLVGLGNWLGNETRGSLPVVARKGCRLDAVTRFQLWANTPDDVETAMEEMQDRLLADKDHLWTLGILRLMTEQSSLAEHVSSLDAWRKTADYRVLFEYQYQETDAESLIARILIDINSQYNESTVVTDEMVRWDNLEAPILAVRGGRSHPFHVKMLIILAFLPDDWDGDEVSFSITTNGTVRGHTFASVRAFFDAFTLEPGTVALGGNLYHAGHLVFPGVGSPDAIILKGGDDIFQISYGASRFDNDSNAVVYLRVLS